MKNPSVIVVGAGLSGLMAARKLTQQGYPVTVVEKGRGVGGRVATRRIEGSSFDHGAQFFTIREPEFRAIFEEWKHAGAAHEWFSGYPNTGASKPDDHYPRYCGLPGMTALAKYLAIGLDARLGQKVTSVSRQGDGWNIALENGEPFAADWLILTPPAEQSLALLDAGNVILSAETRSTLASLSYEPCFALMVQLAGASAIPEPGSLYVNGEVISWVADNHKKGVSLQPGAVTVHASGAWTRVNYETPPEQVAEQLIAAAGEYLGQSVQTWQLHRWRFSKPQNPLEIGALPLPDMKLIFAGDALNGAKIEGATLSGLAAAKFIIEGRF